MWTRSPKSSKCGREIRKSVKIDSKYWTRSPESSKYRGCAVGTRWLASIAICRTIKNLLDNSIRYAAAKALIYRRLVPLLGRLPVCWGCPSRTMRDSSSEVERLRIPRGRKSESAVVLVACSTYDPSIISKSWGLITTYKRGRLKGGCDPFWSCAMTKRKEKAWGAHCPRLKGYTGSRLP
ncbi:hypothetical protein CDL15_Pgr011149 [Punica granatum]|uniref:Uncharacterized protein n=1 Tax=Punica granatum TaxID=22663 RepID=A0A218WYZ7_PUNGR|nr:hypothetical protein CDL15_Pgr011149 [Punica granatum]